MPFAAATTAAVTDAAPVAGAITILGSGRLGPTASALVGLAGVVVGLLALTRAGRRDAPPRRPATIDRWGADAALVLGTISLALGGLFLATADGGPGTGNGVVGSVAALVAGPIAIALGAATRARRRHLA